MSVEGVRAAVAHFGFHLPKPATDQVFGGFQFIGVRS
jgi:hypothetical protein